MKAYLVDHSYGAAVVLARSKEEAREMGDAVGDVYAVYPFGVPILFHISRETHDAGTEDEFTGLELVSTHDWDFSDQLEAVMKRKGIALDPVEYKQLPRHKQKGGPPVDDVAAAGRKKSE